MKKGILALLCCIAVNQAMAFQVLNQTETDVYVKEYYHIFNRYNELILPWNLGECNDPGGLLSSRCVGQLDFRVISNRTGSDTHVEEPLCTWAGDVGDGQGYFLVTTNQGVKSGEKGWCKLTYHDATVPAKNIRSEKK